MFLNLLDISNYQTVSHHVFYFSLIFMCVTPMLEVNLSTFIYRLFHEDFSSIVGTNTDTKYKTVFVPRIEKKSS